jgi:hypothetical protein
MGPRFVTAVMMLSLLIAGLGATARARQDMSPTVAAIQTQIADLEATLTAIAGTPDPAMDGVAVPTGSTATVADLVSVQVLEAFADPAAIDPNADWFIEWLEANPRADGSEFFTVRLRLTNVSREPLGDFDLSIGFTAESGAVFDNRAYCGNVPGAMSLGSVIQPGDTREVNVCRIVRISDIDSLTLYVEPLTSFDESLRVYFELPDSSTT